MQESYADALDCSKCGQSVDQILALQCDHNLCLSCASKIVARNFSDILNSIKCEICGVVTVLDPNSSQVLLSMREQLNTMNSTARLTSEVQHSKTMQNFQTQQQQQQQLQQNLSMPPHPQTVPPTHHNSLCSKDQQLLMQQNSNRSSHQQDSNFKNNINDVAQNIMANTGDALGRARNYSNNGISNFLFCREHPSEEAILFCFTCETPCICIECFLNGLHKNHDVKDIRKNFDGLASYVEDIRFKIKTRADLLLNDECRLTQKKRELIDVVTQAKTQIKANFDELYQVLENKQRELISNTEELLEERFEEIDKSLQKVRSNMGVLQEYDAQLENLYYKSERVLENDVKVFNYYADNKVKILQSLDQMDNNFFLQIKEKLMYEFRLNMQSVYQHVDTVRGVLLEVVALKGLESTKPTNLEQKYFDLSREDRNRRKAEQFLNRTPSQFNTQPNYVNQPQRLPATTTTTTNQANMTIQQQLQAFQQNNYRHQQQEDQDENAYVQRDGSPVKDYSLSHSRSGNNAGGESVFGKARISLSNNKGVTFGPVNQQGGTCLGNALKELPIEDIKRKMGNQENQRSNLMNLMMEQGQTYKTGQQASNLKETPQKDQSGLDELRNMINQNNNNNNSAQLFNQERNNKENNKTADRIAALRKMFDNNKNNQQNEYSQQ